VYKLNKTNSQGVKATQNDLPAAQLLLCEYNDQFLSIIPSVLVVMPAPKSHLYRNVPSCSSVRSHWSSFSCGYYDSIVSAW